MIEDGGKFESNPEVLDDIVEEFTSRLRAGQHPAIEEYQNKHPELKEEIEDLLASVAMIEQIKNSASLTPSPNQKSLNEVSKLAEIANYDIQREIGRGGMGVVFEAIHKSLGRRVAIKVMPTPVVNSEKYIKRFKREAKAAAKLHHTNIVGVFEVGDGEQYYYYVMDFVDGQGLNEIIRGLRKQKSSENESSKSRSGIASRTQAKIDVEFLKDIEAGVDAKENPKNQQPSISFNHSKHFRWAARLGASLADALAYAHDANILHRDIKPSNMILDRKGIVWITDFGLAKDISGEINLTKTGDVIGTPQYLAPESLEGEYDQRSEVYCLGLTLYELATLQPAFKAGSTAEVIRAIATTQPLSPRRVNRQIPIDLSTIIDKAIKRNPAERYQSAEKLKNDLLAFIQDRPISARRQSTTEEIWKWCRRKPIEASLAFATTSLLAFVAIAATVSQYYATERVTIREENKNRLEIRTKEVARQRKRAESNIEFALSEIDSFEGLYRTKTRISREDTVYLEALLEFYNQFVARNPENGVLIEKSARAFRRAANTYRLVGRNEDAATAYENSIELYNQLFEKSLHNEQALYSLAQTTREYTRLGNYPGNAMEQCRQTIDIFESLPETNDLAERVSRAIELTETLNANTFANVVENTIFLAQNPQAIESSPGEPKSTQSIGQTRKAISFIDLMLKSNPEQLDLAAVRANCLLSLGTKIATERPAEAIELRDKAIKSLSERYDQSRSEAPEVHFRLAVACSQIFDGDSLTRKIELLTRAAELAEQLKDQYPLATDFQQLYAATCAKLANQKLAQGDLSDAFKSYEDAVKAMVRIAKSRPEYSPSRKRTHAELAIIQEKLSEVAARASTQSKDRLVSESNRMIGLIQELLRK